MKALALALVAAAALGCANKFYAIGDAHALTGDEITYTIDADGAFTVTCTGNCRELTGGKGSRQFYGFLTGIVGAARNAALMAVGVPPAGP